MTKDLEALIRRNVLAQERFKDLEEYFGGSKSILEDRKEFKKWLERGKQNTKKVDELESKLEQPTNDCKIFGTKENCFGGATEYECNHCDYKIQALEQPTSDDCVSRAEVLKQMKEWRDCEFVKMTNPYHYLEKRIQSMPPVTPKIPTFEDCVSRQAIDHLCFEYLRPNTDDNMAFYEHFCDLPPVTPTFPSNATNYDVLKAVFGNISAFRIKDTMEFEKGFESWFSKPYKRGNEA